MKKQILLHLLFGLFPFFLSGQLGVNNLEILPSEDNVLRYSVSFASTKVAGAYLELAGDHHFVTNISPPGLMHQFDLIGLRAETTYELIIHLFDQAGETAVPAGNITTGSLPADLLFAFDSLYHAPGATSGFVMSNARGGTVAPQVRIFDREGRVVWYEYLNFFGPPCIGYRFTQRHTILYFYGDCQTVVEINLNGDILHLVNISDLPGDLQFHHDVFLTEEDHLVAVVGEKREIDKTSIGGPADVPVIGDGFIEIDWEGSLYDYWTVFDHYDPLTSSNYNEFWTPLYGSAAEDWFHANGLTTDTDGNYLFSLNRTSQMLKVDRNTGEIIWTLGQEGDFAFQPPNAQFEEQHVFTGLGENRYLVFDNKGGGNFSRVSEFELQEDTGTAILTDQYDADSTYFTGIVGSAYRLENGNTLICFGRNGILQEIDSLGQVVWHRDEGLVLNYRAYYVPWLYEPIEAFILADTSFCAGDAALIPTISPAGGYFSGPGVVDGELIPADLNPGAHALFYTYGYRTDTFQITIQPAPEVPEITEVNGYLYTNASGNLQWYESGTALEGATADSLLVVDGGTFQVAVTGENGCVTFSPLFVITSATGLDRVQHFTLSPVPSRGPVSLNWHDLQDDQLNVSLLDQMGREIYQNKISGMPATGSYPLDFTGISAGLYYLKLEGKEGLEMLKIVIK